MNELSLFTGAGGGVLGSRLLEWKTVCGVEIEPYCREIILRRQEEGILEPFPMWDDIRTFEGKCWRGKVDIITAGFPCQPFSVAGKGKGQDDERNMWPETIRIIREVRPRYCLLENVPGLLVHEYTRTIFQELAESGYDCEWNCVSAAAVGAPHKRDRLWILAYSNETRGQRRAAQGEKAQARCNSSTSRSGGQSGDVAIAQNDNGWPDHKGEAQGQRGRRPESTGSRENVANSISRAERSAHREGSRRDKQGRNDQNQPGRDAMGGNITDSRRCHWWDTDPADIPDTEQVRCDVRESEGEGIHGQESPCDETDSGSYEFPRINKRRPKDCDRPTQPRLGRVAHGVANRVDRLKAIGNGQVPEVVRTAWELLKGEE